MDRDCIIALNIIKFWNFNVNLKNHINFLRQEIKSHIQLFNQTSFTSLLFVFTYFHLYVFLKCLYIFSSLCVPKYFVWIWKNQINFLWQKIKSHTCIQLFNQTSFNSLLVVFTNFIPMDLNVIEHSKFLQWSLKYLVLLFNRSELRDRMEVPSPGQSSPWS